MLYSFYVKMSSDKWAGMGAHLRSPHMAVWILGGDRKEEIEKCVFIENISARFAIENLSVDWQQSITSIGGGNIHSKKVHNISL